MFNNYFYKEFEEFIAYISITVIEGGYEFTYYKNQNIIVRRLFKSNSLIIENENEKIQVEIKGLKIKVTVEIDNKTWEMPKTKHKQLKAILSNHQINNEINPIQERLKFKLTEILFPLFLIIIGLVLYHIVRHKPNYWEIPSTIVLLFAYFKFYTTLFKSFKLPILDIEIKLLVKVILTFLSMAVSQDLMNYI